MYAYRVCAQLHTAHQAPLAVFSALECYQIVYVQTRSNCLRCCGLPALHTGTGAEICASSVLRIRSCHRTILQPPALATRDSRAEATEPAMGVFPARIGTRWAGSTHAVRAPLAAPRRRVLLEFRSACVPAVSTSRNTSKPARPVPEAAPARRPRRRKTWTGPRHMQTTHAVCGSSPRVAGFPCSSRVSIHRTTATTLSSSAVPQPCAIQEPKSCVE